MTRILTIIGGWLVLFAIWNTTRKRNTKRVRTIIKSESDRSIIGDGAWAAPAERARKHQRICTCNREPMGA